MSDSAHTPDSILTDVVSSIKALDVAVDALFMIASFTAPPSGRSDPQAEWASDALKEIRHIMIDSRTNVTRPSTTAADELNEYRRERARRRYDRNLGETRN